MTRLNRTLCSCAVIGAVSTLGGARAAFAQAPSFADSVSASPTSPTATMQPSGHIFTDVFSNTIGDFRGIASKETLTWFGIGAVAVLAGHSVDHSVSGGMSAKALEEPFESGDMLGRWPIQLGGALATYTLGHVTGQPRMAEVGAHLLRAQLVAKTLTVGLKTAVNRQRPDGTAYSFPSGHTSASFATATILQREFGWKVGLPSYGLASYIAASRLQAQKHFLSDVAFGAAIGIASGYAVTIGHGEHRLAVAPAATPGGAAISFTVVGSH